MLFIWFSLAPEYHKVFYIHGDVFQAEKRATVIGE